MKLYSIYKITNLINGKMYVGFTGKSIEKRFYGHKCDVTFNNSTTYLHNAMRKYGFDNFEIECLYQSHLRQHTHKVMESYFIAEYDTFVGSGYNLTAGGEGFSGTHSARSKKKMSESALGRKASFETKEKMKLLKIGERNPKFKGYYITPWGKFSSLDDAQTKTVSRTAVQRWCYNPNKFISKQAIWQSPYLKDDNYGQTFGEIGFTFESINTNNILQET